MPKMTKAAARRIEAAVRDLESARAAIWAAVPSTNVPFNACAAKASPEARQRYETARDTLAELEAAAIRAGTAHRTSSGGFYPNS